MPMTRAFRIMVTALAVLVVLVIAAGPSLAQPTYPPTSVAPTTVVPPDQPEVQPEVEVEQEAEAAPLAFTGAELTLLVAAFGILLAGGAVALIAARRRSRAQHI
jgi:hypothetical protein